MNSAQRKPGHTWGPDYQQLGSTFLTRKKDNLVWRWLGKPSNVHVWGPGVQDEGQRWEGRDWELEGWRTEGKVEPASEGSQACCELLSTDTGGMFWEGPGCWDLPFRRTALLRCPTTPPDRRLEIQPARTFFHIRYTCMYLMQSFRNGGSREKRAHFRQNCVHVPNRN